MCGICGEVSFGAPPDVEGVRRASRAIAHRGPDAEGFHSDGPVSFGHRRLSIIDLATGDQPMVRDGIALVFNGEAYDFQALREELKGLGHTFNTRSDTEVVLVSYLQWGERFAEHVHGMFALALWDSKARKLVLARDRLGKKPLYYWQQGSRLVFGSELKALLAHGVPRELSQEAFIQYLACEYVPAPLSIYQGIYKLPAAHVAVFDAGGFRTRRYWDLPMPEARRANPAELLALLDQAVAKRLVADVPVGVFLSGGVDSTAIAALATRHSSRVRTFSIGFTEASFDESPWALLASQKLGTEHTLEKFSGQACIDLLPAAAAQLDEPLADPSFLPTLLLSRFTRKSVTVALAGDGGDELFAGYDPFLAHQPAALFAHVSRPLRSLLQTAAGMLPASSRNMSLDFRLKQFLRGVDARPSLRHQSWLASFLPGELQQLLSKDLRPQATTDVAFRAVLDDAARSGARPGSVDEALRFYVTRYLADDILVKADRASMAASLELRAPFLDTAVVEYALRLPWQSVLSLTQTKVLLKRALKGVVPEEILRRPKKGFGIPVAAWIRGPLRPVMEESMNELGKSGLFEPKAIQTLLQTHLSGRADLRKPLWTLLMFQLWQKSFGAAASLQSAA
ncbi:MAG TPA: asparagine synthase (glutamine-hydrolyzing) [Myxococcales bacterium]|nr:asparagine synthase (glutamine-hydrolyzing) [Myxococcales bacterium]